MSTSANAKMMNRRQLRDSGHLLLAILLMMALMIIAATYEAPRVVQQLKRDREEEMIHRGTEYARAIKKYYKKFGAYPTSIEQLEDTNKIRFLRKRYKDPLTKDGKWTLLHYNDVVASFTNTGAGPGIPAAGLGSQGQQGLGTPAGQQGASPFGSSLGSSNQNSSGGFGTSSFGGANPQPVNQNGIFGQQQPGSGSGQQVGNGSFANSGGITTNDSSPTIDNRPSSSFGNNPATGTGTGTATNPNNPSTTLGNQQGLGGQTFGAGAIIGVGSKSKDPTIRIYNKKKTYDEWQFIYNPVMDQANVLLKGPYSPSTLTTSNVGTPAGQQNSPFGQQNSPFGGQQPGGMNNPGGTLTPGGSKYPPDQSH
jgi:type II secretory pathway pseudopilin PulG